MNNGTQNSLNPKFYLGLLRNLLIDLERFYPEIVADLNRDWMTIRSRVSCEGLGFLTKTLPKLGKAIDASLAKDIPLRETGFSTAGRTALPAFLRGLLGMVFSKTTGRLLKEPSVTAVTDVRQICFMFYKLEVPYESSTMDAKVDSFTAVDNSLPASGYALESPSDKAVCLVAKRLLDRLLSDFKPLKGFRPKHGPGAVATGESMEGKYTFPRRYEQLEEYFPFEDFFLLSYTHFCDTAENNILNKVDVPSGEATSRMAAVPKDSRGPRLIGMEPLELMWVQQGIKDNLYDWIETHPLSRGHVNFTDQGVNRSLALSASLTSRHVTLDMSEASDRVSLWLVEELFGNQEELIGILRATRSQQVQLPDGKVHFYKKFAPMGSALCFPIEALVFWSLAVAVLHVKGEVPLSLACRSVWVYGDDIITLAGFESQLYSTFESFGLKFNDAKCCTGTHFRESCGCDAFRGEEVNPIRVKSLVPLRRTDATSIVSYVSYSNALYEKGHYAAAAYVEKYLRRFTGALPLVSSREIGYLGYFSRTGTRAPMRKRWNKDFQRYQYRVTRPVPIHISRDVDNWSVMFDRLAVPADPDRLPAGIYPQKYRIRLQVSWV